MGYPKIIKNQFLIENWFNFFYGILTLYWVILCQSHLYRRTAVDLFKPTAGWYKGFLAFAAILV